MADYKSNNETEVWNMATETMKRLSRILNQCSFYSQNGHLIGWFNATMDLRRNISPFIEDKKFSEIEDQLQELPKNWRKSIVYNPNDYAKVNEILDKVYIEYVKIMKTKGLLMPKSMDVSKAIINM